MMLPKVEFEVARNVEIQATRDVLKYVREKAMTIQDENQFLSTVIHSLSLKMSEGDDTLYKNIYLCMLVVADIINTQIEVNDLRSWN